MSTPQLVVKVVITLADGSTKTFGPEEIDPGAHYATSRNFTRPPRKRKPDEPKVAPETWIQHEVHFLTNRESVTDWSNRVDT